MAKREFVQLSHKYEPNKINVADWFMSEKLDGTRAFWDGGITQGMYADEVCFANVAKDGRLVRRSIATGLWSRYGKVIHAPREWLAKLPKIPLDGELYLGRNSFQKLVSITKTHEGSDWSNVQFVVFDSPPLYVVLGDGEINNTNFKKVFVDCIKKLRSPVLPKPPNQSFQFVYEWLKTFEQNSVFKIHEQVRLPKDRKEAELELAAFSDVVLSAGGEGVILRQPNSHWTPTRTRTSLKHKPINDDEAIVIGCVAGRETDLGSKLKGLMGALLVQYGKHTFELSGFTNEERILCSSGTLFANSYPGVKLPEGLAPIAFPIGSKVSFKYRELTDAGIPKEARYWRKREE